MGKAIILENIKFGYDKILFENLNLEINNGDFIGLIGANGCGKSTLLKIITGELSPNKGKVYINNKDGNVGYLQQMTGSTDVSFPITPVEVVSLNLYNSMGFLKISNKEIKERALNALSMVDLEEKAYYNYNNMSGGEQQRTLIAKALVNNSKILIFDEPTSGLDYESKNTLYNTLKHLNLKHKITIIIVTHELDFSKEYFNKIIKLKNGELKEYSEVKNNDF